MESKESKFRIIILVVFLLVNISILTASVVLRIKNDSRNRPAQNVQQDEVNKVVEEINFTPKIINIPPSSAKVGDLFEFNFKPVDQDTLLSEIIVVGHDLPSWLKIDGFKIYGTPTEKDKGNAKIVVEVSDGKSSSIKEFYLLVE